MRTDRFGIMTGPPGSHGHSSGKWGTYRGEEEADGAEETLPWRTSIEWCMETRAGE